MPSLEEVDLERQALGAACMRSITAHTQLTRLRLYGCALRAIPAALSRLTALRCLDLTYNEELARGWHHLAACTGLTRLTL